MSASVNGEHPTAGECLVNGEHMNSQDAAEGKHSQNNHQPLKLSGALDQFESFHSTPCIGTEFPRAKLFEWLRAPNSDELIRDLAITSIVPSDHSVIMHHSLTASQLLSVALCSSAVKLSSVTRSKKS